MLPLEQAVEGAALGASAGRAPSSLLGAMGALGDSGGAGSGRGPMGLPVQAGALACSLLSQKETPPLGPLSAKVKVTGGKVCLEFGTG